MRLLPAVLGSTVACSLALLSCQDVAPPAGGPGAPRRDVVVSTFEGEADLTTGAFTIRAAPPAPGELGLVVDVPVVQDGTPGSGPADTVELVTEPGAAVVPGGCGAIDSFEASVRLRSFHGAASLRNTHVELLRLSATGREACNGAPPVPGTSDAIGLFGYGTLATSAAAGDSVVRRWKFRLPDTSGFTFAGRVVADVVPACPGVVGLPSIPALRTIAALGPGQQPNGLAVEDLDADGDLDVVVTYAGAARVAVALNAGDDTFSAFTEHAVTAGSQPWAVAAGDVTGDGRPDLVVALNGRAQVAILANLGGGAFGAATYVTAPIASDVLVADLDADGRPDVALATSASQVAVVRNLGGGAFAAAVTYAVSGLAQRLRAADLDANGVQDLVVGTSVGAAVFTGTAGGGLVSRGGVASPSLGSTGYGAASSVAVSDLTGDGRLDLAITNRTNGNVTVFRGNAGVSFTQVAQRTVAASPSEVAAADLDGDGRADDLLVASDTARLLTRVLDPAVAGFSTASVPSVTGVTRMAAVRLRGDAVPDVALLSPTDRAIHFLVGDGAGGLVGRQSAAAGAGTRMVAIGDVNGDGTPDLVASNASGGTVSVHLGLGGGAFAAASTTSLSNQSIALGDLDCDGHLDVFVGALGGDSVLWGAGDGTFSAPAALPSADTNVWEAVVADLDGDRRPDLVTASPRTNGLAVRMGTCTRTLPAPTTVAALPVAVAVADMDGDERPDLVAVERGASSGGQLVVALGDGAGSFGAPARTTLTIPSPNFPTGLAVGDLDGDGLPDAATAWVNGFTLRGYVSTFRNTGGALAAQVDREVAGSPSDVAAGDLDGDGMTDLVASSASSSYELVTLLRNDGAGGFSARHAFAGDYPSGVVVGDVDGAGLDDVVVALSNEGRVGVLPGRCLP